MNQSKTTCLMRDISYWVQISRKQNQAVRADSYLYRAKSKWEYPSTIVWLMFLQYFSLLIMHQPDQPLSVTEFANTANIFGIFFLNQCKEWNLSQSSNARTEPDLEVSIFSEVEHRCIFNFPSLVLIVVPKFVPKHISETPVRSQSSQASIHENTALLFPASHFPDLH